MDDVVEKWKKEREEWKRSNAERAARSELQDEISQWVEEMRTVEVRVRDDVDLLEDLRDPEALERPDLNSLDHQVGLIDVHYDMQRIQRQLEFLERYNIRWPCLIIAHDVGSGDPNRDLDEFFPLPILLLPASSYRFLGNDSIRQWLEHESERRLDSQPDEHITPYSAIDAERFYRHRLTRFLTYRFRGRRHRETNESQLQREDFRSPPTFPLTAECDRHGLKVFVSPAYAVDDERVFGNKLTSPVDGYLSPGLWKLGTMPMSGAEYPHWEYGYYDIPSDVTIAYLNGPP